MGASREQQIEEYSWRALSCNPKERAGLAKYSKGLLPQLFSDVPLPDTPIVKGAMEYVEKGLLEYTFDHSLCVFIMEWQLPRSNSPNGNSVSRPGS